MSGRLHASGTGGRGTPLVLLHGFGGTHRVWDGVRAALEGDTPTLAYDLPGHGGSLAVPVEGGAKAAARAVLADLEARGITRFHLAGHSFGGAVSILMALAKPERAASLTLFAPGGIGPEINAALLRAYASASTRDEVARSLARMTAGTSSPAHMIEHAMGMRARPGQVEALALLCEIITRDGTQGTIPREKLAALTMPVHVVWGARDRVLPVRQAADLPPHFARHIFSELGHMLPEEAPEAMAKVLGGAIGQQSER